MANASSGSRWTLPARWLPPTKPQRLVLLDRIYGALVGCALGDAYGLVTEFLNKSTIKRFYGDGPIQFGSAKGTPFADDLHRSRWVRGDWTDDTDQMILIMEVLSENQRANPNTSDEIEDAISFARKESIQIHFEQIKRKEKRGIFPNISTLN